MLRQNCCFRGHRIHSQSSSQPLKCVLKKSISAFEISDNDMKSINIEYRDYYMLEQVTLLALKKISTLALILVKTHTKGMTS